MENALKANPKAIADQYDKQIQDLQSAYGEAMLENRSLKKVATPSRPGRQLIQQIVSEMASERYPVSVSQDCRWSGYSRRSWYYVATRAKPKINSDLAVRVKRMIDDLPYAGYRTVAWLLGENKNTIQRLFQLKGWQVRKRRSGMRL